MKWLWLSFENIFELIYTSFKSYAKAFQELLTMSRMKTSPKVALPDMIITDSVFQNAPAFPPSHAPQCSQYLHYLLSDWTTTMKSFLLLVSPFWTYHLLILHCTSRRVSKSIFIKGTSPGDQTESDLIEMNWRFYIWNKFQFCTIPVFYTYQWFSTKVLQYT
jgi:hypothetical protein